MLGTVIVILVIRSLLPYFIYWACFSVETLLPGNQKVETADTAGQDSVVSGHQTQQAEWVDMGPLKLVTLYNNHIKMPVTDKKYKNIIYK